MARLWTCNEPVVIAAQALARPAPRPAVAYVTPLPPPPPLPQRAVQEPAQLVPPQQAQLPALPPLPARAPPPLPQPPKARYMPSMVDELAAKRGAERAPAAAQGPADALISAVPAPLAGAATAAQPRRGLKHLNEEELCCPITHVRALGPPAGPLPTRFRFVWDHQAMPVFSHVTLVGLCLWLANVVTCMPVLPSR